MGERVALVLRPLGLGDFCTAVPALRALRRGFPGHRLLLACAPAFEPLAMWSGAVDAVLPAQPLQPLRGIDLPDVAVDLHGRGPASQRILLATHPRRLIAFANPAVPQTRGMPAWHDDEHEVMRWCRLLNESGIAADATALQLAVPDDPLAERYRGWAMVHPGAAYASRRWPAERYAAVARHLLKRGLRVLVTAGPAERELAACVCAAALGAETLVSAPSLLQLLAVVGRARLVVCGDTGVAHLATATGTPSVLLFGPTPPALWGPPPGSPRHTVLWPGVRGDPHGTTVDRGLLRIGVADVVHAIDAELAPRAATGARAMAVA